MPRRDKAFFASDPILEFRRPSFEALLSLIEGERLFAIAEWLNAKLENFFSSLKKLILCFYSFSCLLTLLSYPAKSLVFKSSDDVKPKNSGLH